MTMNYYFYSITVKVRGGDNKPLGETCGLIEVGRKVTPIDAYKKVLTDTLSEHSKSLGVKKEELYCNVTQFNKV